MSLIKCVEGFLSEFSVGKILVALSGGADSVCLLYVLKELDRDIAAFHLNHSIRGEEADSDEMFCKDLCNRLGVEFYSDKVDVPSYCKENRLSIEEGARDVRYRLLTEKAKEIGAEYIATAHNADDNAETVLLNLVRGCSVDGLMGIPKVRGSIIRPLLEVTREEIEDYLFSISAEYVTDSTNSDQNYSRNKIRNSVIPVLRSINPSFSKTVLRLSSGIETDKQYFSDKLEEFQNILPANLSYSLLTRQIAKKYFDYSGGEVLHNIHITNIAETVKSGKCVTFDLPSEICVYVAYGNYKFAKRTNKCDYCRKIDIGITEIHETGAKVFYGNENVYKLATSVTVNCDKIIGGLYARQRKEGDRIKVFGVSKNVRKELINKKIPLYIRNLLPVICDSEGIVYVPYIGADDRVFSNTGQYILGLLSVETEKVNEEE